jgi:type IV fimbrial biogenesis protein FimT
MPQGSRGFTLIEAMIALAVTSTLIVVAVPACGAAMESARATSTKADLVATLTRSITHAATAGSEVVLCPGGSGGCRNSSDWSHGWIAYADIDGNRQRGANETLLQAEPPLAGKVHLRSTAGRVRVVFRPNGGNTGSNVTFTLCDGRGLASATTLVLANDGRLRAGTPTTAAAAACIQAM